MSIRRAKGTLNEAGQAVESKASSLHINSSIETEVNTKLAIGIATTARKRRRRKRRRRKRRRKKMILRRSLLDPCKYKLVCKLEQRYSTSLSRYYCGLCSTFCARLLTYERLKVFYSFRILKLFPGQTSHPLRGRPECTTMILFISYDIICMGRCHPDTFHLHKGQSASPHGQPSFRPC